MCENTLETIAKETGKIINSKASSWSWRQRDVYLIDGTVINLEDTKQIRDEFPLTFSKDKQQGQPKLRLLGMFSLASGSFLDGEIGKYTGKGQSEVSLMRKLLTRISKGSVLVLDRFFTSYFLQVMFLDAGIDYVIRGRDKSVKKLLGRKSDRIVEIQKPRHKEWQVYQIDKIPQKIKVRVMKSSIKRRGFRTATIYIMTSFLDQKTYSKEDIEKLYIERWGVELDIRHLKNTLNARQLSSKSPSMARKEL